MIDFLRNQIKNKSVLLLGFGREGKSSLRMILKAGGYTKVGIADQAALTAEDVRASGAFPSGNSAAPASSMDAPRGNSPSENDLATNGSATDTSAAGCVTPYHVTANASAAELISPEDIALHTGPDYQDAMDAYDIVFKSPGIVLKKDISEYACRVVSQTELFFAKYHDQIVGITGTKGKSTTAALLAHILQSAGRPCMLAGNIGIPVFDHCEEITPDMTVVVELSCHQLEYMTVSSAIGVLINIYEEHLDHYGTMEKYTAAKQQIYRNQLPGDVLFCNVDFLPEPDAAKSRIVTVGLEKDADISVYGSEIRVRNSAPDSKAQTKLSVPDSKVQAKLSAPDSKVQTKLSASDNKVQVADPTGVSGNACCKNNSETVVPVTDRSSQSQSCDEIYHIPTGEISLLGHHNYFDIAIDYGICRMLGLSPEEFTRGLKTYETLPHRLKLIAVKNGVKYYDDSISTIDQTAIEALHTLPDADTILLGGMDRGIDYGVLIEYLKASTVRNIILMEATGRRIYREIMGISSGSHPPVSKFSGEAVDKNEAFPHPERLHLVDHLEDAVSLAKKVTRSGHSCILSPAAASYGIFKNFEERGDRFAELVQSDNC